MDKEMMSRPRITEWIFHANQFRSCKPDLVDNAL